MPGKQPVHTVALLPSFRLFLQLYREQHVNFIERAVNAGVRRSVAACLVNDIFVWLQAQPALLADKETAEFYLTTTFDELVADVILFEKKGSAATVSFDVLAAKHPDYFTNAINHLPSPYRTITRLYLHGLSEKHIAARINVALSIVKRRLSFSLFLLKTQFAKKPKAPV